MTRRTDGPTPVGKLLSATFRRMDDPLARVIAEALEEGRDPGEALVEYLRRRDEGRAA